MKKDASDIHLIAGIKPVMRVRRDLISYEDFDILTEEDMWEIYDYFVRGNVDKDRVFKGNQKIRFFFCIFRYTFKSKYFHFQMKSL